MAFPDPTSVVYNGNTISLVRVGFTANTGTFKGSGTGYDLGLTFTQNEKPKSTRSSARLVLSKNVPDPIYQNQNVPVEVAATLVLEGPASYTTPAERSLVAKCLLAYLSASTYASMDMLSGGQI